MKSEPACLINVAGWHDLVKFNSGVIESLFCHLPVPHDVTLPAFGVSCHVSTDWADGGGRGFVAPLES